MGGTAGTEAESRVLFGLRSNVEFFQTPEQFVKLEGRMKISCLLFDRIIIQRGVYQCEVMDGGSFDVVGPVASPDEAAEVVRRNQASLGTGKEAHFAVNGEVVLSGPARHSYFSELESLVNAIGPAAEAFVTCADPNWKPKGELLRWLDNENRQDREGLPAGMESAELFLQHKRIDAINVDAALSLRIGATLSPDPIHLGMLAEKIERSGGTLSCGGNVVGLRFPYLVQAPWDEILDLRRDPAVAEFRRAVGELDAELTALAAESDVEGFLAALTLAWDRRIAEAFREAKPTLKSVAVDSGISLVCDFLPIPFVGSAVGAAKGAVEAFQAKRSLGAFFLRLAGGA